MELLLRLFDITRAAGTTAELWLDDSLGGAGWVGLVLLCLLAGLLPLRAFAGMRLLPRVVVGGLRVIAVLLLALLLIRPSVDLLSPLKQKEH